MPPRVDEVTAKATVRDATPEEASEIFPTPPWLESWIGVLDRDGKIEGHICLTRQPESGQVFGHNTVCESPDSADALKLWRFAKKQLKKWGTNKVFVHIEVGSPARLMKFWTDKGAEPKCMMYELTV